MNKEIQPIRAKTDDMRKYGYRGWAPSKIFDNIIHNSHERGWDFSGGDPEMWKFKDRLLVPGGRVLDLGIGTGRSSIFFALQGMSVTGYETSPYSLTRLHALAKEYDLPIEVREEDFSTATLEKEAYDTALLAQSLVHSPSKTAAYTVIERAIDALKPGGHLWLRSGGKLDTSYDSLQDYALRHPEEVVQIDEDVFEAPCDCSGVEQLEPFLFLDPVETVGFFASRNMSIVHTQLIPEKGKMNIMYGENWEPATSSYNTAGMITVLAQKPFLNKTM